MFNLLVVDDEYYILEGMKYILDWDFYNIRILTAENAVEAMNIINTQRIDIVLTDVRLRGVSGIDMIRELKNNDCRAYFIVMSAYTEFEYVKSALKCGVSDYLVKPIDKEELTNTVLKIIRMLENENKEYILSVLEKIESDIRKTNYKDKENTNKARIIYDNIVATLKSYGYDESDIYKGDQYRNIFNETYSLSQLKECVECFYEHCAKLMHYGNKACSTNTMSMMKDYIDENYTKNITLSKLEKKFLSDFTTLSKNFKQCYGITYHQYLTQKRMEKAKELLCNSDMKINAIASTVGYSDVKYFRYLFKKYYGKSPKDFKSNS